MSFNKLHLVTLVAAAAALQGCALVDHTVAKSNVQTEDARINVRFDETLRKPAAAQIKDSEGIWVNKRSMSVKEETLPAVFKLPMTVRFEQRSSLRDLTNFVSRETGIRFTFAPDVAREVDAAIMAPGFTSDNDLRTLLTQLTSQSNMSWKYRGGGVEVFRFDTQVFQVAAIPGTGELSSSVSNRSGSAQSSGGSGSSSSSGQEIKYSIKMEFWKGLQNDLKNIMSRDGKDAAFTVSEATNTITATGTPATLAAVESYVKDMNANRLRQVALEVRAYTVAASDGRDFGLKWDLAYSQMAKDLGIAATMPSPVNTALGTLTAILGPSSTSRFANSALMLNALSTLGTTNVAVDYTQMAMTGELVMVNSLREVNYLSKVSSNAVPNAGTSTSLEQSTITEGFSFSMLPVVLNGDTVMLKGNMDISTIDKIDVESSGGQTIRTPKRSTISLPMTVTMKSGETYVYGIREAVSSFSDSGLTGTALINTLTGGQHGSNATKKTIVVTITPHLINPKSN